MAGAEAPESDEDMADEKSRDVVIVGEQQVELERRDRVILGGLCVALLCVLAVAIYAGLQLWKGTWALDRVAPSTWGLVGVGAFLLTLSSQIAINEGWWSGLRFFVACAGGLALFATLGVAIQEYGLSRVLGGALIASPLLLAVGGWILWRRAGAEVARTEPRQESGDS